jgi:hypothetical protein
MNIHVIVRVHIIQVESVWRKGDTFSEIGIVRPEKWGVDSGTNQTTMTLHTIRRCF